MKNEFEVGTVVALKRCRVSDYNGKSLNASAQEGDILLNAKHPRTNMLSKWINNKDISSIKNNIQALSNAYGSVRSDTVMTLQEMMTMLDTTNDEEILTGAKSVYFMTNCWTSWIFTTIGETARPLFYMGCTVCRKKVLDEETGYRCEKCIKVYD